MTPHEQLNFITKEEMSLIQKVKVVKQKAPKTKPVGEQLNLFDFLEEDSEDLENKAI